MGHSPSSVWMTSVPPCHKLPQTSATSPSHLQGKELRHRERAFPKVTELTASNRAQSRIPGSSSSERLDRVDLVLCLGRPGTLTVAPFGPVIPWGPRTPWLPYKVDRNEVTFGMLIREGSS